MTSCLHAWKSEDEKQVIVLHFSTNAIYASKTFFCWITSHNQPKPNQQPQKKFIMSLAIYIVKNKNYKAYLINLRPCMPAVHDDYFFHPYAWICWSI